MKKTLLLLLLCFQFTYAQGVNNSAILHLKDGVIVTVRADLNNNGTINNHSELNLEESLYSDSSAFVSDSGSVIRLLGGIQHTPGMHYANLIVNTEFGNGSPILDGDAYISESMTILMLFDFDLGGNELELGPDATLTESGSGGIFGDGRVFTTRELSSPFLANIGGIGGGIFSPANLGTTTINRWHQPIVNENGAGINKVIEFLPENNEELGATMIFNY